MTDTTWSDGALLARFTEFYEDVAVIKQAIAHGRLPLLLGGDLPAQASPADLASMVSGRLSQRLLQQGREMAVSSPEAELRAYRIVQFVMAGLGDEVFILEVDWPGNTHWLSNLIEYALFRRQQAGRTYFELLGNLLHTRGRGRLQLELGIIFLLTLQLGFKGEYRGQHGQAALASYRSKLLRYIADRRPLVSADKPVFSQAYSHTLIVKDDHRLAPMKPWYRAGAIALLIYLVISTAIWLQSLVPLTAKLDSYMGGG